MQLKTTIALFLFAVAQVALASPPACLLAAVKCDFHADVANAKSG
jgi:hypothetical protein